MILRPHRFFLGTVIASALLLSFISSPKAEDRASQSGKDHHTLLITKGVLHPFQQMPNEAAGFFTIQNKGPKDLLLTGVKSPVCGQVTSNHNGQETVKSENEDDNDNIFRFLAIPHDSIMVFPASGYHLVCHGAHNIPQDGEKVPFSFHFLSMDDITVSFTVQRSTH